MVRSFAFTVQGQLHLRDIEAFLMPTLLTDTNLFLWVDLEDPTPEETRFYLEEVFHFHPLSIEDCVVEHPTPKVEEYLPKEGDLFEPYLFIVTHAIDFRLQEGHIRTQELNFFLGRNFLVTYHPASCRPVERIAERCLRGDVFPARAPDRVAHLLLDAVVEGYQPPLDEIAQAVAEIEEEVLGEASGEQVLSRIIHLKKEVNQLSRVIAPQRDLIRRFANGEFQMIRPQMLPYFRDVHDAFVRLSERVQSYLDALTSILQVYLNISSYRTSEIVKVLTIITVITMPLMLVGTWYGMNFRHMPELESPVGYPIAAAVTLLWTVGVAYYFRRKKWW